MAAWLFVTTASAGTLASATMLAPLAPEQEDRLSIALPPEFAPDKELWLAYELVALSPDARSEGEIGLEQAFEGVMTPANAMFTTLHADKMQSEKSAGTLAQRLQEIAGPRDPAELQRMLGAELFAAYKAVDSGEGRMLAGRVMSRLPAPGTADARLLISVERASGMQPLAVKVTVGQGELPAEFQTKVKDSAAYKIGFALGLALFGWLVMRLLNRRRD